MDAFVMADREGGGGPEPTETVSERTLRGLQEGVHARTGPCVMVVASASCEAAASKNGVNLVELLRPLCDLQGLNAPVRTVGDAAYRLQSRSMDIRLMRSPTEVQESPQRPRGAPRGPREGPEEL